MENKANYALIGAFVLMALMATIGFTAWLSNAQFDQQYDEYTVEFSGPVRGVSKGSEVRLNGLSVGEVTRLAFHKDNPNSVDVFIQVIDNTPIFKDGYAQLEPQGLTGLNYVQIYPGDTSAGRLNTGKAIPGRMSQLDSFLDGGENIIDGATAAIRRVNIVLDQDAIEDFHSILDNINYFTGNLRDTRVDGDLFAQTLLAIEQAAKDVSEASIAVEQAANDFDILVSRDAPEFLNRSEASLNEVDETLNAFEGMANNASDMSVDMREAINRLSNSGLTDMEETADAMRSLLITLNQIAEELERSPASFIAGEEKEMMKLPQ